MVGNHCRSRVREPLEGAPPLTAYHVTIRTQDGECLLGDVVHGAVKLSWAGRIVEECWREIPAHLAGVVLDASVVMPNHVHGLVVFTECEGSHRMRPLDVVVGAFKSAVSEQLGRSIWEAGYRMVELKGPAELGRMRRTIVENPVRWAA